MRQRFGVPVSGLGLLILLAASAVPSAATTIDRLASITGAQIGSCSLRAGGSGANCRSTGFVDDDAAAPGGTTFLAGNFHGVPPATQSFVTAFNTWNDANSDLWSLAFGGDLDLALEVRFTANAESSLGGLSSFTIHMADYHPGGGDPGPAQLGWVQGIYANFQPPFDSGITAPAATLDTYSFSHGGSSDWGGLGPFSLACAAIPGGSSTAMLAQANPLQPDGSGTMTPEPYCDPLYPFQQANEDFFDAPQGLWGDASFRAITLPATVTYATAPDGAVTGRTLTVYDGVSWGFDLQTVAEPAGFGLFGVGLLGLAALRRRVA